jgi:uncharacterized delta-60 repeat protein
VQADGRILVSGDYATSLGAAGILLRYDPNGGPDNTFGNGGKVLTNYHGGVAIEPDGKILVEDGNALERFNSNGSVDIGFGNDGVVNLPSTVSAVAFQSTGKIIVAGTESVSGAQEFAVTRLNTNGTVDNTFENGGTVTIPASFQSTPIVNGVIVLGDGDIVLAGTNSAPNKSTGEVQLLSFGGAALEDINSPLSVASQENSIDGIALVSGDTFAITGTATSNDTTAGSGVLMEFTDNDTTLPRNAAFGNDGAVVVTQGVLPQNFGAPLVRQDGTIVVTGQFSEPATSQVYAAQYLSNGQLDTSFGSGGYLSGSPLTDAMVRASDGAILYLAANKEVNSITVLLKSGSFPVITPTNMRATVGTGTAGGTPVTISWTDNATNETGYVIERASTSSGEEQVIGVVPASPGTGATLSFVDDQPVAGPSFYYTVIAVSGNAASAAGPQISIAVPTAVPPPAPILLTLTNLSPTENDFQFYDNSENETQFVVERSVDGGAFTQFQTIAGVPYEDQPVTFKDTTVQAGHQYYYRVYAVAGELSSAYSNITAGGLFAPANPGGFPNAPYNVLAQQTGPHTISLSFVDISTNETGFIIMRAENSSPSQIIGVLPPHTGTGQLGFVDNTVTPNNQYTYLIEAVNGGYTAETSSAPITTTATGTGGSNPGGAPNSPFAVTVASTTASSVTLHFIDNSANETGFVILRSTTQTGPYTQAGTVGPATGTHGTVTFVDASVAASTTYYYEVYAANGSYQSSITSPVAATTSSSGGGGGGTTTNPGGAPNGPYGIAISSITGNTVVVSFIDNATNETGFVIERATSQNGPFTQVGTAPAAGGSGSRVNFTDSTITSPGTYYYKAYAVNGTYQSSTTGVVSAQVGTITPPPANPGGAPNAPFNLTATAHSDGTVAISFIDNANNETGFVLQESTNPASNVWLQVATFPASPGVYQTIRYTDKPSQPGVIDYRVYAVNGPYLSSFTGPVQVTAS